MPYCRACEQTALLSPTSSRHSSIRDAASYTTINRSGTNLVVIDIPSPKGLVWQGLHGNVAAQKAIVVPLCGHRFPAGHFPPQLICHRRRLDHALLIHPPREDGCIVRVPQSRAGNSIHCRA
eukprot:scaffold3181_cov389-Prasinococcus_capsulatus_cf.AAC.18